MDFKNYFNSIKYSNMNEGKFEIQKNEPVGTQLKKVRNSNGMTLVALAEIMGTDAPHLSRIEKNNPSYQPTLPTIMSYLKVFGYKEVCIKI